MGNLLNTYIDLYSRHMAPISKFASLDTHLLGY